MAGRRRQGARGAMAPIFSRAENNEPGSVVPDAAPPGSGEVDRLARPRTAQLGRVQVQLQLAAIHKKLSPPARGRMPPQSTSSLSPPARGSRRPGAQRPVRRAQEQHTVAVRLVAADAVPDEPPKGKRVPDGHRAMQGRVRPVRAGTVAPHRAVPPKGRQPTAFNTGRRPAALIQPLGIDLFARRRVLDSGPPVVQREWLEGINLRSFFIGHPSL